MAVREFDGVDDFIQTSIGSIGGDVTATSITIVTLAKSVLAGLTSGDPIVCSGTASSNSFGFYYPSGASMALGGDGSDSNAGANHADDVWQIQGVTRAAGASVTPRFHGKTLGSGTWAHNNGSPAHSTTSTSPTKITFGTWANNALFMNFRLAVVAIWKGTILSDADFEAIESGASTATLMALNPSALWDFNQPNTTTKVFDLSGNGAHETSITGTTVVTGDDPAWTFGLTSFPTLPVIDNFNRANEGALAAPWAGPLYSGEGQLALNSNTCDGTNGNSYYTTTFGPDCEAYFTIPRKPTDGLSTSVYARIGNPSSSFLYGYNVRASASAGTDGVEIYRIDNQVNTLLGGAGVNLEIVNGDALGISCVGSTIRSWYKPVGGEWAPLQTVTDSTYSAAGYLAMEAASSSIDDFGGGTITGEAPAEGPTIISTIQMRSGRW